MKYAKSSQGLSSATSLTKRSWRRQRTSSLNDEAGFAGSDRGMLTLRMTVFSGSSIDVATAAPISVEVSLLRLFGTSACFPSVEKQSKTLLPAIDLAVLAVSEGAEVSLSLPAAAAAVCVATSAAGFDRADLLLVAIAEPAEAESNRTDRITNNNTKRQRRGGNQLEMKRRKRPVGRSRK